MEIAFLGSSLLSSYWNGAATYYRGIIAALARKGCRTTFYEPDAYDRQQHRDIAPPDWAKVVVYPAERACIDEICAMAATADVVVKTSGVGVFDDELLTAAMTAAGPDKVRIFWDVDAPATIAEMDASPSHILRRWVPHLDLVLTYGGGPPVIDAYEAFGARACIPVYNALDPETHYPGAPDQRFACDLAFLGNRLPDREARVDRFFLHAARALPDKRFIIGGSGWEQDRLPANVHAIGHVSTRDHNAFNATPLAVINIARESMARIGYSPATRVFEAAGAAACLISDEWEGIGNFLEPGTEVLVARNGDDIARHLIALTPERAREIGERARRRVLREHTYDRRADALIDVLRDAVAAKRRAVA